MKLWDYIDVLFANTSGPKFSRLFHVHLFHNICLWTCYKVETFGHFHHIKIILLAFFKNTNHLGSLNLLGCFVLSQSTNFFVHEKLNNFLPRIFLYFVREEIFAWKKNRNFEELTSANFYWKFAEWTFAFTG